MSLQEKSHGRHTKATSIFLKLWNYRGLSISVSHSNTTSWPTFYWFVSHFWFPKLIKENNNYWNITEIWCQKVHVFTKYRNAQFLFWYKPRFSHFFSSKLCVCLCVCAHVHVYKNVMTISVSSKITLDSIA